MHAVCLRIEHLTRDQYRGRVAHAMRTGYVPGYVGTTGGIEVVTKPASVSEIEQANIETCKRCQRRAPNKSAAVASELVLAFGTDAQKQMNLLSPEEQRRRIVTAINRVAARLGTECVGLVIHRDETAIHAHAFIRAIAADGKSVSNKCKRQTLSELQGVAAQPFADLGITRGKPKRARMADGEPEHKWTHRTVAELHRDLPAEIAAKQKHAEKLTSRLAMLERQWQTRSAAYKQDVARVAAELARREIEHPDSMLNWVFRFVCRQLRLPTTGEIIARIITDALTKFFQGLTASTQDTPPKPPSPTPSTPSQKPFLLKLNNIIKQQKQPHHDSDPHPPI